MFYMLKTFLKAIDVDPSLLLRLNGIKKHFALSSSEMEILRELEAILQPFEIASNDFQADYETIGNVIPAFLVLKIHLTLSIKDRNGAEILNPASPLSLVVVKCKYVTASLLQSLNCRFSYVLYEASYVLGIILRLI